MEGFLLAGETGCPHLLNDIIAPRARELFRAVDEDFSEYDSKKLYRRAHEIDDAILALTSAMLTVQGNYITKSAMADFKKTFNNIIDMLEGMGEDPLKVYLCKK